MMTEQKECRRCKQIRPTTEFHREKRNKDGLKSYCRTCCNKAKKAYDKANPGTARNYYQKRKTDLVAYQVEYNRKRKQTDPQAREKDYMRTRLYHYSIGKENKTTEQMYGYTAKELVAYLESILPANTTLLTIRQTHQLDHIVPLDRMLELGYSWADANAFDNLQWLKTETNKTKSNHVSKQWNNEYWRGTYVGY